MANLANVCVGNPCTDNENQKEYYRPNRQQEEECVTFHRFRLILTSLNVSRLRQRYKYTLHWWTDTEGSLAAAVEEMPAGYDALMKPVIDNVPMLIVAILLTIPVAILAMRLAERALFTKNRNALCNSIWHNIAKWLTTAREPHQEKPWGD